MSSYTLGHRGGPEHLRRRELQKKKRDTHTYLSTLIAAAVIIEAVVFSRARFPCHRMGTSFY